MNHKAELSEKVENFIRPEIRALSAYHVPDPGDMIKLDAMENPYQWPEDVVDQWLDVIRDVELNRYPDPGARVLKDHLRDAMDVPADSDNILLEAEPSSLNLALAYKSHISEEEFV